MTTVLSRLKKSFTMKVFLLILLCAVCGRADENSTAPTNRQRRAMLFFDDDGNLMKLASPYLRELAQYAARRPEHENFLKYFFNFLRPLIINTSTAAYMIPVSEDVIQQINRDPIYQNRLTISKRGPDYNPLCTGRRTQIASPASCNSFLSCWDGWAYELECPEGLMFSSEGYCDYADSVQCKDRSKPIPEPSPRCKQDFETFRNELNCNEFFVCVNRKPVKFKCPAELVYSQKFGVCDYPNLVDCSNSPASIPESPSPSEQPSPAPAPMAPSPAPMAPSPAPIAPTPIDKPSNKPILIQRPIPSDIENLPATFPSFISGQINKIPELSPPDHRTPPANIIPGAFPDKSSGSHKPEFQFAPKISDGNAVFMQNSVYNNQNWQTPVAIMSPEDAVRFLKFNNFADSTPPQ